MDFRKRRLEDEELKVKRVNLDDSIKKIRFIQAKSFSSNKSEPQSNEVIVKITGNGKTVSGIKAHLNYISRDCERPLINEQEITFDNKEELKYLAEIYHGSTKTDKRETLNIVFSFPHVKEKDMIQSVSDTIKKLYPDNQFLIAFHEDSEKTHAHIVLKLVNNENKRIDIRKKDLSNMRLEFSKNLNKLNYKSKATIKEKIQIKDFIKEKKLNYHHFEVIDYGWDKYKNDPTAKNSYFIKYKTAKGKEVTVWSVDLKNEVKEKNISKGDIITLKKLTVTEENKKWNIEVIKKNDISLNNEIKEPLNKNKESQKIFQILEYGKANYLHKETNSESYYLTIINSKNEKITLWSKEFENKLIENNLSHGDKIEIFKSKERTKNGFKNNWDLKLIESIKDKFKNKDKENINNLTLNKKVNNSLPPSVIKKSFSTDKNKGGKFNFTKKNKILPMEKSSRSILSENAKNRKKQFSLNLNKRNLIKDETENNKIKEINIDNKIEKNKEK